MREIKWTTDVPDKDGYLTYFGMDNHSLRRKLGLRKGDKVNIIIVKEDWRMGQVWM